MQVSVEPSVERIGSMQCGVGESPIWHAGEQALYWTDIPGRRLWRWIATGWFNIGSSVGAVVV